MLKPLHRAIAAASLLALAAGLPADDTDARQAYGAGNADLQLAITRPTLPQRMSDWASAEKHFKDAVGLKPDYADAWDKLGQAQFNQEHVFDAVTSLKHAVVIDPRLTEAWYDLGFALENLDSEKKIKADDKTRKKIGRSEVADAVAAYRQALAVDPVNDVPSVANAQFRLGVLLRDEAVKAAEAVQAASLTPSAALLPDQANLKEAMGHLEEAVRLVPDFPEAHNELGRVYDLIARYNEAIDQYTLAINGEKDYAEAYSNRGVAWWKAGNWDKALEDCRKATEIKPDFAGGHYNFAEVVFARVEELRLKGGDSDRSVIHPEAKKAVDEYSVATQLDPDMIPAWYGLAKAYHGYFDYANAEKTYARIVEMDKRQKRAKVLLKEVQKEEKAFVSHIPKQYRDDQKGN